MIASANAAIAHMDNQSVWPYCILQVINSCVHKLTEASIVDGMKENQGDVNSDLTSSMAMVFDGMHVSKMQP